MDKINFLILIFKITKKNWRNKFTTVSRNPCIGGIKKREGFALVRILRKLKIFRGKNKRIGKW